MNKHIGDTIFDQLGGNRFVAMTGSKNFVWNGEELSLTFRLSALARKKAKANTMKIIYDHAKDTYTMQLIHVKRPTLANSLNKMLVTIKKNYEYVYFDMLQDIFTEWTGLYTKL